MDPKIKQNISSPNGSSLKVIRKLGTLESLHDYETLNGSLILSRAFVVTCPKVYNLNLTLIKNACSYWIKKHPFLQSYVYRPNFDVVNKGYFDIDSEKYYALMDRDFSEYNNLEYLESNNPYEWRNIIESEVKKQFDCHQGPLWRLKLIKINDSFDFFRTNEESTYAIVLTNSHVIADGRNLIKIMLELFNIINSLLINKPCDEILNPAVIESLSCIEDLIENNRLHINIDEEHNYLGRKSVSSKTGSDTSSRQNFDYLFLKSDKVNRLIKKSKLYTTDAKLTGILSTILCLSMKKLFKKYEVNDIDFTNLKYEILVSLRDKFGVSESQMGIYSIAVENSINFDELNAKTFWKIAEQQSKMLHKKLKHNEDIYNVDVREIAEVLNEKKINLGMCNMFAFSNVGRINYKNDAMLIKLKQHYVLQSLRDFSSSGLFFNGISSTPGNDLCWSFNYIEKYYSKKFIKELKFLIVSLIEQLISENEI